MRKIVYLLGFVFLILTGCASMDKVHINDMSIRQPTEEFILKPDFEAVFMRMDLVRATHTETSRDSKGNTTSRQVPNPYSPLCVSFGNGIMMDVNQNLFLNLSYGMGLQDTLFYSLDSKTKGFISGEMKVQRISTNYIVSSKFGFFKSSSVIFVKDGYARFNTKGNKDKCPELISTPTHVEYVTHGLFKGKWEINKLADGSVVIDKFWKNSVFSMPSPDVIKLDKWMTIQKGDAGIYITYNGIFGMKTRYTFAKTTTGYIFFDATAHGVELVKNQNTFTILKNGKVAATWNLLLE